MTIAGRFNPRAPRGTRPAINWFTATALMFQSTRPARDATVQAQVLEPLTDSLAVARTSGKQWLAIRFKIGSAREQIWNERHAANADRPGLTCVLGVRVTG